LKASSKLLLPVCFALLCPAIASAQPAGKNLQCVMFQSSVNRSVGDEAFASATVNKAGYVMTGGGCQVLMADGKNPVKPPGLYQNKPDGNRWLCRAHNDQGPTVGAFTVTAYAMACGLE
jgi:hypothetical protein